MPIYTDQTIADNFDPGLVGPSLPLDVTITTIEIDDADGNGLIQPFSGDLVNGSEVTDVWVDDTVTLNGDVITGVTFYTEDGSRYFTPSDESVLTDGTVTDVTFVLESTQFPVGDFGPPCFVAGARIAVPGGHARVEELAVGDLVETLDHGPQTVRWVGQRTVPGKGAFAPVRIEAGALGAHGALSVSPQHCLLIQGWRAELHFGAPEVLCPAHMLVDGDSIRRIECAEVSYVHVMCDGHEILHAEGLASESFFFGDYLCQEGSALRAEILALFPEMADRAMPRMTAARRVLRAHEAGLVRRAPAAQVRTAA